MKKKVLVLYVLIACSGILAAQDCLDKPYPVPDMPDATRLHQLQKAEDARKAYAADTTNPEKLIWYGRRLAYPGLYRESIAVFTSGIRQFPQDARFLRHRGHRYITLRCFSLAEKDLAQAATLTNGKRDETEPDGQPNAQNIPTSTLQTNIYYHLGLAQYLQQNYRDAAASYREGLKRCDNPDMYMAMAYWLYISLRRGGMEQEAQALLTTIDVGVQLIENEDYYRMLMLYKGAPGTKDLPDQAISEVDPLRQATLGYAMGLYFLLNGDRDRAEKIWKQVQAGSSWGSFGRIAAESESHRPK